MRRLCIFIGMFFYIGSLLFLPNGVNAGDSESKTVPPPPLTDISQAKPIDPLLNAINPDSPYYDPKLVEELKKAPIPGSGAFFENKTDTTKPSPLR